MVHNTGLPMAASRHSISLVAAGTLLLSLSNTALAGPGFIESSRVQAGDLFTEVTVRFKCGVNYLEHSPRSTGDQLVLHLETNSICDGVAPSVVESREQLRPPGTDAAKLVSIEYDGGGQQ